MRVRMLTLPAVLAAMLMLSACGDDDDASQAAAAGASPATPVIAAVPIADVATRIANADPVAGADLAGQCRGCHTVDDGGRTIIGPNLFGVVGGPVAHFEGFAYSPAMAALGASGSMWTYERLDAFLMAPGRAIPGTRMGFDGLDDPAARADIIAWLRLQSSAPPPLR